MERSTSTRFFPGYHAFPGGVVDAEDGDGEDSRRNAAVRELAEETGVQVKPEALEPAGRLVTPPFGPTRYDTSFYMCELPVGAHAEVDGKELVSGAWWTPEAALRGWERDAMPIPPPTLAYLRLLGAHDDPRAAAAAGRATDGKPHHERFRIEIHPGLYVLPLRAPTLPPATTQNCYLFDSDPILLVDPGTPYAEERVALFHTLDAMLKESPREILVLLTHHHTDHVGSVQAVQDRYGVRVLASPWTQAALPEHFVDGVVAEGHVFDVGHWAGKPWRVEVLHTPGHTPGHLAFRDMRWGAIVAGDLVSGVSTIVVDPHEGNMGDYLRSLERCSALEPRLVLPGHGPAQARDVFADTLAHRRAREKKILDALTQAPQALDALVPVVYADTPQAAWGLAVGNLESALLHLQEEGKVVHGEGGWRLA